MKLNILSIILKYIEVRFNIEYRDMCIVHN